MEIDEKLRGFVVGSVPTVIYIPEFIDEAEETQIFNNIYQAPISKWKSLKNRRLQNWGSERWHIALMTYTCALVQHRGVVHEKGLISQDLPPWLTKLTQRIHDELGIFSAAPNHVLINEYLPNQGIMPHQDGPAYFPAAAILSLGSPVVMNFTPHLKLSESNGTTETGAVSQTSENAAVVSLDNPSSFSLLLMPRSLLVFKDLAYSDYLHGIEDNAVQSFEGAANLTRAQNDSGVNEQLLSLTCAEATESGDGKILHRTTKRVSLTCRLVLKVRKNLIKI
ncbi:Alpha-ketoglutarate-dependent dioxygenase alkB-like protein 6 [Bienertia sinuspersici]